MSIPSEKLAHIPQGAAEDMDLPKRALILPGGGLRLSYAAGAMQQIFAHDLKFQHMDGTSGGSLNLAMLLSGLEIDEICERWRSLNMLDTFSFMPFKDIFNIDDFKGASSSKGFREQVYPHLGIDFAKIRAAQGVQGTFNVCNFTNKMNQVIEHQHITEDLLVAGMSLPGTLPPVIIEGTAYLDSGFIQDANLLDAVKRGANELWLIWIMGNIPRYRGGALDIYVQMLEMSANGALQKELQQIKDINNRITQGEKVYGHQQPITLHLIKPEHPLPLDSALYLGEITHTALIKMGQSDARAYFNNMQPEGVPFEPYVTKMTELNPGIQFKETMAGGFSLDATEPNLGCDQGKRAGTELSMHAQIDIDDIDKFVAESEHPASLIGTIDYSPMGTGIVANSGIFNLFYPTDNPKLKLMVYELGFEFEGEAYYLAGKKEVRDESILDLWPGTTTLYTQLHKGTDKSGPVVGAGILTLGVTDLLNLVSTIEVLHADSSTDKVKTIAKFGKFFMGELWDSYVKHG
ncbi:patatin-like phospholipase family protein [Methyloprofundus sp.]|uniref:patatin-like phospholipase family protein n=1 Tax=Methyloprofundus sp. TaxID=2020875 RepID=UPI003D0C9FCD